MMDIKKDFLQWFLTFFGKNSKGSGTKSMLNQQLSNKLQKSIIRKL